MTEEIFKRFVAERTRIVPMEKSTLKELHKAFNRWSVLTRELFQDRKKISLETFKKHCEDRFGDSRGKHVYIHVKVFLDEEDVEEYDINQESPYTDAVPSVLIAENILQSQNKKALIVGLIEDKRACSSEIDDLEAHVARLEDCIKRKTNYTEKLLNNIALLYMSLPDGVKQPASNTAQE
jgi:hypothetical protein